MDWDFDGEEFDEESKLRAETRKIMELPDLPIQATCVRVPVMVGHAEAVWIETEDDLSRRAGARAARRGAVGARRGLPVARARPPAIDDVLVGRIRRDPTVERGLALFLASDNLRKGAALNAIQIAELVLDRVPVCGERQPGRSLADIGMLGRFFGRLTGGNWRPPADELRFAAGAGFDTVQIRSDRAGEIEDELGAGASELGDLFADAGLEPVLEMLVRHEGEPGTLAHALESNLDAIEGIGVLRVHIHPVGPAESAPLLRRRLRASARDRRGQRPPARASSTTRRAIGCSSIRPTWSPCSIVFRVSASCGTSITRAPSTSSASSRSASASRSSTSRTRRSPRRTTISHSVAETSNVSVLRGLDVPLILEIGGLPHSGRSRPRHGRGAARLARTRATRTHRTPDRRRRLIAPGTRRAVWVQTAFA